MSDQTSSQSGHDTGDDRDVSHARSWWEVELEVLWRFTSELCAVHTYRGASELTGLAKETLRTYVERTTRPSRATRKLLGEFYLQYAPGGATASREEHEWRLRPRMMDILPPGEHEALAALARFCDRTRWYLADELPPWFDHFEEWIDLQIRGEYRYERDYVRERLDFIPRVRHDPRHRHRSRAPA